MFGEVSFTWGGVPVRAVLDESGRWTCTGPEGLAQFLNAWYPITGLMGRRQDVYRARLKEVARRFGGQYLIPRQFVFPQPFNPERHPGFIRLRAREA